MLRAEPSNWFSWSYDVLEGDQHLTTVNLAWIREAGSFELDAQRFDIGREPGWGDFVLSAGGEAICRARKPSAWFRSFQVTVGNRQLTLEAKSPLNRAFVLREGGATVGDIRPQGILSRRAVVTNDARLAFWGKHACRMTATRGSNNGAGLIKWFGDGHDEMYARFYVKFAEDAGYTHHFVHLNGSPDRWGSFGKAGLRPRGDDFFTTGIEPWFDWGRNPPPGKWMFYTYWPEMKGSRDGKYWGNGFYPDSGVIRRGKWICMEIRVKMNTPGREDGEQSVWQDGRLIGHFTGINWRTSEKLKANVFWLMSYVTDRAFKHTEQHAGRHKVKANTEMHTAWFDQVVVATAYIGPTRDPKDG